MSISFTIVTTTKGLWRTLSKNEYEDCMQPLVELIDNAIAAKATIIIIVMDFEKGEAYIEDNGCGFPSDPEGLSRCFTYAPDSNTQTDLNEHGCGLKSSLSILDPRDIAWSVTWKSKGKFYTVKAPYAQLNHVASEVAEWPGKLKDPSGTLIKFPIDKKRFNSLYQGKSETKAKLEIKLKEELSHYWMKHPRMLSGDVKMKLNEEDIKPFVIPHDDSNYVKKTNNFGGLLPSGAKVEGVHYVLSQHIPGSPWFKKANSRTGVYLYKNGRIIQKVTGGQLFKDLVGQENHPTLNGNIIVVNVSGNPEQLPITVPTKNKFKPNDNPNFDELVKFVNKNIEDKIEKNKEDESEERKLDRFKNMRTKMVSSIKGITHKFYLKEQIEDENLISPQLDAIEIVNKSANVYEAKKENKPSWPHISQLYSNYVLSHDAIHHRYSVDEIIPILIIDGKKGECSMSEQLIAKVKKLHENSKCGFPMEIRNYDNDEIYCFNQ